MKITRTDDPHYVAELYELRETPWGEKSARKREVMAKYNVSPASLHRDLRNLGRPPHPPRRRKSSLGQQAEDLIKEVIEDFYLTRRQPTKEQAWHRLETVAAARGMATPCSRTTFHRRLRAISEYERWRTRREPNLASKKFETVKGRTPEVPGPLHRLQIDHQKLDIICVDSVERQEVGRPWLTAAIDTYSHAVVGFYLGYEAPSRISMGLCLSHVMSPKEDWLKSLGVVGGQWPMWGVPYQIATDNAAEFKSEDIRRGYAELGMAPPEFRPVAQPQYGGMIERLFRTLKIAHEGSGGSTGRSVATRSRYSEPGRTANKTLHELTQLIAEYIACEYHPMRLSKERSPLELWEAADFERPFSLTRRVPADPTTAFRCFLPRAKRKIQHYGVTWDRQTFVAPVFDEFLRSGNLEQTFCRDPRDCRQIFLIHPDDGRRIEIPNRAAFDAPVSFSEYKKYLDRPGAHEAALRQSVYASRERRDRVESEAEANTARSKRARKKAEQRRQYHASPVTSSKPPPAPPPPPAIRDDGEGFGFDWPDTP